MVRGLVANDMFRMGKLFQQNIVDAYTRIEKTRLEYYRLNQKRFRIATYQGLIDHLENQADRLNAKLGSLFILPSSFVGGARYMRQAYQDAMAIVRKYGKPDLFITFTANPNWDEIKVELNGQPFTNRPDICVRVFNCKLNEFMREIIDDEVLGRVIAHVAVIEFQHRGLPHAHILITFDEADRITSAEQVDEIIWAEIPDPIKSPELHELVIKTMRHSCDQRCLNEKGQCKSFYPKPYADQTIIVENGITRYKRREQTGVVLQNGHIVTNQHIVPYNPYFLMKYKCHINFEWCSSANNVKYLFKYIFKGHDLAELRIQDELKYNEIDHYVNGRSVSSFEGIYRIYSYDLKVMSHSVERLPIHDENLQSILIPEDAIDPQIKEYLEKDTMLLAWFKLNQFDTEARKCLYEEIPQRYVFKNNKWEPRKRQIKNLIVRIHSVSPKNIEIFCLRVLLLHIRGIFN